MFNKQCFRSTLMKDEQGSLVYCSMGLQRVGCNLVTEQQFTWVEFEVERGHTLI